MKKNNFSHSKLRTIFSTAVLLTFLVTLTGCGSGSSSSSSTAAASTVTVSGSVTTGDSVSSVSPSIRNSSTAENLAGGIAEALNCLTDEALQLNGAAITATVDTNGQYSFEIPETLVECVKVYVSKKSEDGKKIKSVTAVTGTKIEKDYQGGSIKADVTKKTSVAENIYRSNMYKNGGEILGNDSSVIKYNQNEIFEKMQDVYNAMVEDTDLDTTVYEIEEDFVNSVSDKARRAKKMIKTSKVASGNVKFTVHKTKLDALVTETVEELKSADFLAPFDFPQIPAEIKDIISDFEINLPKFEDTIPSGSTVIAGYDFPDDLKSFPQGLLFKEDPHYELDFGSRIIGEGAKFDFGEESFEGNFAGVLPDDCTFFGKTLPPAGITLNAKMKFKGDINDPTKKYNMGKIDDKGFKFEANFHFDTDVIEFQTDFVLAEGIKTVFDEITKDLFENHRHSDVIIDDAFSKLLNDDVQFSQADMDSGKIQTKFKDAKHFKGVSVNKTEQDAFFDPTEFEVDDFFLANNAAGDFMIKDAYSFGTDVDFASQHFNDIMKQGAGQAGHKKFSKEEYESINSQIKTKEDAGATLNMEFVAGIFDFIEDGITGLDVTNMPDIFAEAAREKGKGSMFVGFDDHINKHFEDMLKALKSEYEQLDPQPTTASEIKAEFNKHQEFISDADAATLAGFIPRIKETSPTFTESEKTQLLDLTRKLGIAQTHSHQAANPSGSTGSHEDHHSSESTGSHEDHHSSESTGSHEGQHSSESTSFDEGHQSTSTPGLMTVEQFLKIATKPVSQAEAEEYVNLSNRLASGDMPSQSEMTRMVEIAQKAGIPIVGT